MSYPKNEWSVDDGLREVCRIVRQGYLAECMGVKQSIVSKAISHGLVNGKPYELTADKTELANRAIQQCAMEMKRVVFSSEYQGRDEFPYSFGDGIVEQVKTFRKRFCAPYIFSASMGWTERKIKMHLSDKTQVAYYNKVSQEDLDRINEMVQWAARDLERIVLVKSDALCASEK